MFFCPFNRTNLPKEVMAFPDFPFSDCEGKSFIHHTQVLQYLKDYAENFNLYKHIKVSLTEKACDYLFTKSVEFILFKSV